MGRKMVKFFHDIRDWELEEVLQKFLDKGHEIISIHYAVCWAVHAPFEVYSEDGKVSDSYPFHSILVIFEEKK